MPLYDVIDGGPNALELDLQMTRAVSSEMPTSIRSLAKVS
jgi:hypothetical protein